MSLDKNPFTPLQGKPAEPGTGTSSPGHNPYAAPSATLTEADFKDETYQPRFFSRHGRLGRIRYLTFLMVGFWCAAFLGGMLMIFLHGLFSLNDSEPAALIIIAWAPMAILVLMFSKRRFNDLGLADGFALLTLIPFLNLLVFLYLILAPGNSGPNRYGRPAEKNSVILIVGVLIIPSLFMVGIGVTAINAYRDYQKKAQEQEQKLQQSQNQAGKPAESGEPARVKGSDASSPEKDE